MRTSIDMTRSPLRGRPAMIALLLLLAGCAACGGSTSTSKLPSDLPPPEYETPRSYDMGGAPQAAPTASPSAAPSAPPPKP